MVAWYLILCIFISTTVCEKTLRAQDITALQRISSHFDFNWNLEDISLCQISELSCREMSEGLVLYAMYVTYRTYKFFETDFLKSFGLWPHYVYS